MVFGASRGQWHSLCGAQPATHLDKLFQGCSGDVLAGSALHRLGAPQLCVCCIVDLVILPEVGWAAFLQLTCQGLVILTCETRHNSQRKALFWNEARRTDYNTR